MPPRRRLGVALLIGGAVGHEIDGLRRAVGDRALGRIAPHITLVPPVNVRPDALSDALAVLRAGAGACGQPLRLDLGPPTSFLPANPVLILGVGGDVARLRTLRDAVFVAPLRRLASWPWVPHVTLADGADAREVEAAVGVLGGYRASIEVERVVALEESGSGSERRWRPLADVALAPARFVGRGGLALELTRGCLPDPEAVEVLGAGGVRSGPWEDAADRLVVTARRADTVVGMASAWRDHAGGHVGVFVAIDARGQGIGSHLLAHMEAAVDDAGWACPVLAATGPAGFYRARSTRSVPGMRGGG